MYSRIVGTAIDTGQWINERKTKWTCKQKEKIEIEYSSAGTIFLPDFSVS